jgi:NAD-dependent dihydropyrimidine dehydrogenase PreA subunit
MKAKILIFLAFILTLSVLAAGRPFTYQITPGECWNCGRCVMVCPVQAINYIDELNAFQIDQSICNGDGLCVSECPHGAIHQVVSNHDAIASPAPLQLSCYPNPMKSLADLEYRIPLGETGKMEIFNIKGQSVKKFNNLPAGENVLHWNGQDQSRMNIPSGCYFIKLSTRSISTIIKITKER